MLAWLANGGGVQGSVEVLAAAFANQNDAIAAPDNTPLRVPLDQVGLERIERDWWQETLAKYPAKE